MYLWYDKRTLPDGGVSVVADRDMELDEEDYIYTYI